MQTRTETSQADEHPNALNELPDSLALPAEDFAPTTSSQSSSPGLLSTTLPSTAGSLGNIEHVVVLDLTGAATTTPVAGVAGLEGALPSLRNEWLDRAVNVLIASIALVAVAPLMLVIAIAIKLSSRGPILYAQPRIGLNRRAFRATVSTFRSALWARFLAQHDNHRARDLGGRVFRIYKFRTMCEDAESATGAVWAQKKDPRATAIGCFLRKYRLDELPQLINVLKGDMNIVGPRPERPSIFARMRDTITDYGLRQSTRPGITGWAQINLFYDSCVDDVRKKVMYDLEYLRSKTLTRDLSIMMRTLPAMLFRRRGW